MIDSATPTCPRVDPSGVRHLSAGRNVLLYNVATDSVFETNEVGLEIVQRLDGNHTLRQVAECLAAIYSQPIDPMLADVSEMVGALELRGFVEWS